jgi:hypothetical protein
MDDCSGVGPWISSIYHFPYSFGKGFELESVMLDCGIKYLRVESACLDHIKKKYSIKRVFYVKIRWSSCRMYMYMRGDSFVPVIITSIFHICKTNTDIEA